MTTTSAGNGPSAGDGRSEDDGAWGWFTPAPPATGTAASTDGEQDGHSEQAEHAEQAGGPGRAAQSERPRPRPAASSGPGPGGAGDFRPGDGGPAGPGPGTGAPGAGDPGGAARGAGSPGGAEAASRPIGPVVTGAGAGRALWAETAEETEIPVPAPPDPGAPYAPGALSAPEAPAPGEGGAPAPGSWPDGGPEAPREHPAPAPSEYGRSRPQAQPPLGAHPHGSLYEPPPAGPYRADAPPQPRNPLYDDALAAVAPPVAGVESHDAMLIRRTLDEVEPHADAATAYFYALLFVQNPELRDLFPASMDAQRDRLFRALLTAVRLADEVEALSEYLSGLGRGHRKYGTLPQHYPAVGECLLGALAQYAPRTWSQDAEDAWVRAYTTISQTMIDAAAEDEQHAPAWWNAEIVAHELRTSEIAVLTLRPDQPYPFLAGQYASVETPWWPRVWRHYSFASSPRPDGLITFHVKAVPTGWVSNALVHRARPGDVLRLGPPAGTMTVDHTTDTGLLCLGGGTGIAPIRALVEDVAQHGRARPVEVFYGARSDHDLYDLDTMTRLEQQHRWLSVRPVVSNPPGSAFANALAGQLPDAVRQHGPWTAYDGYLSGPPGMIRNGVDALVASGVPAERIRHDSLAELMGSGDRGAG